METEENEAWTGGKNPWVIAVVVTLATFMEMLDTSISNVALPQIAGSLSASADQSTWVLTSYLLANAIVLPISGFLSSKVGRKRYYMFSVFLFTTSSLACGFAPSLGWLVFFRLLQGVGGGGLAPCEQAILADTFPAAKRGMAMAVYGLAIVLAPALGPAIGGFITDHYSWRWIFLINIPVGICSLLLTQHWVSDPPHLTAERKRVGRIDYIGLALVSLGLGCMELVLSRGQEWEWLNSSVISTCAFIAIVALSAFVVWEWRHKEPIVDVRLFKHANVATANMMMLLVSAVLYGTTVLFPLYVQSILHYSSQQAGFVLAPGALVIAFLMPVAGAAMLWIDGRIIIAFGFAVMTLSLLYVANRLYPGIDFSAAVDLRCVQIVGVAFLFVPINTLAYEGVAPARRNAVSALVNLSRNIGGEIGIALVTTLIARRSFVHQAQLAEHVRGDNERAHNIVRAVADMLERSGIASHEATRKAYALVFNGLSLEAVSLSHLDTMRILAIGTACMLPLVMFMKRPARKAAELMH